METQTTQSPEYIIPEPPRELYLINETPRQQILNENANVYRITKFDYTDGINVYYETADYPRKGFPTPEAVWAINHCKRPFIEAIKLLTTPMFVFSGVYFLLLTHKRKIKYLNKIIASYNRMTFDLIRPHLLKEKYQMHFTRELFKLINGFLVNLGIDKEEAIKFAQIISHCFEYDDSYRYRLEDLFSEITKAELFQSPGLTVDKMALINSSREFNKSVGEKFTKGGYLLILMFLFRRFKQAFRDALLGVEFKYLQLDEADKYWVSTRNDYHYMGQTYEEKSSKINVPIAYKVQ